MNENSSLYEVDFFQYCPKCKHGGLDETKDPCNECLATGGQELTSKPIHYEEAK